MLVLVIDWLDRDLSVDLLLTSVYSFRAGVRALWFTR